MTIQQASFVVSNVDVSQCPASTLPEYAFIGRSNVGKSSLINALCRQKDLAKTSSKPGKTLLINHFLIQSKGEQGAQSWHLVDLPGYGYAKSSKAQRDKLQKMIQRYCLLREPLVSLFVLIDSRLEPQTIDLEFIQWLGENDIPFALIFTKIDKLSQAQLTRNAEQYKAVLSESWEELPPIFYSSAEKGKGCEEILAYIDSINQTL